MLVSLVKHAASGFGVPLYVDLVDSSNTIFPMDGKPMELYSTTDVEVIFDIENIKANNILKIRKMPSSDPIFPM